MRSGLDEVAELLDRAGVKYAVIGAHAVNVWLEPRFTVDIDITVQVSAAELTSLERFLSTQGLTVILEHGAELPSGPDFIRLESKDRLLVVELQTSKTDFQRQVIDRARREDGVRIATPEDLIVMKLIADRPKDQLDLLGLIELPELDWPYIEHWAGEWGVDERLDRLRSSSRTP